MVKWEVGLAHIVEHSGSSQVPGVEEEVGIGPCYFAQFSRVESGVWVVLSWKEVVAEEPFLLQGLSRLSSAHPKLGKVPGCSCYPLRFHPDFLQYPNQCHSYCTSQYYLHWCILTHLPLPHCYYTKYY